MRSLSDKRSYTIYFTGGRMVCAVLDPRVIYEMERFGETWLVFDTADTTRTIHANVDNIMFIEEGPYVDSSGL